MEWISVEDDLPEDSSTVLCCDIYNTFVSLGRYIEQDDLFELMNIEGIEVDSQTTHWMPLPIPPKGY